MQLVLLVNTQEVPPSAPPTPRRFERGGHMGKKISPPHDFTLDTEFHFMILEDTCEA